MDGTKRTSRARVGAGLTALLLVCPVCRAQSPDPVTRVRVRVGPAVTYAQTPEGVLRDLVTRGEFPAVLVPLVSPPAAPAAPQPPMPPPEFGPQPEPPTQAAPVVSQIDLGTLLDHDPGPPSREFRDLMNRVYAMTAPADLEAAWFWTTLEPEDLGLAGRAGNGVHRFLAGLPDDQPWGSENRTRHPAGTRGTLRTTNGVQVRGEPFGATVGLVAAGAELEVLTRSEDNWYQVRGPDGEGWVSGYWLRF